MLLTDPHGFKQELDTKPTARSPEAAHELIASKIPDDIEIVTLIPASAFHTFIRARTWSRVK